MSDKYIVWEQWQDPMEPELSALEHFFDDDEDMQSYVGMRRKERPRPFALTPNGFVPIGDSNYTLSQFNLWVGHMRGMKLTEDIAETIMNVDGVEVFDVFSPMRFRLGVGKAYEFQEVRQEIERILECNPPSKIVSDNIDLLDEPIRNQVLTIKEVYEEQKKSHWSIYVLPNGTIDCVADINKNVVQEKHSVYAKSKEYIGGNIFVSESLVKL